MKWTTIQTVTYTTTSMIQMDSDSGRTMNSRPSLPTSAPACVLPSETASASALAAPGRRNTMLTPDVFIGTLKSITSLSADVIGKTRASVAF